MPLFSRNIRLGPPLKLSNWRKASLGMWRTAGDPSVYGFMEIDVRPAMAYVERVARAGDLRVTLSHFATRAVAEVIARHPQINSVLRWGRLYSRKSVDLFVQVATDEAGQDLSGILMRDVDRKTLREIALEIAARAKVVREQGDPEHARMKKLLGGFPGMLEGIVLRLVSFFAYTLNLWTPLLGLPRDAFGSAMVTHVGSLGLDAAFSPLVPYSRTPMLVAIGAAKPRPIAEGDQVRVAPTIHLCVTFDHRVIDGKHASHMSKTVADIFAQPEKYFGKV